MTTLDNNAKHMNIHLLKVIIPMLRARQLLSKCSGGKVAALITSPDFEVVYAAGHNGGTKLMPCLCDAGDKYTCIHAEINALLNSKVDYTTSPAVMLISKAPCVSCAAAIVNANIRHVYYIDDYRCTAGIDLLKKHGVETTKLSVGGE